MSEEKPKKKETFVQNTKPESKKTKEVKFTQNTKPKS